MRVNYVGYEWTIETIEDGDIVDTDFSDLLEFTPEPNQIVGLRRYTGSASSGITGSSYAYPENGELPTHFDDGERVPARYHAEYKNWLNK